MSRIAIIIKNTGDTNQCLLPIKKITKLSLSEIKNRIANGHPIVEYELFASNHSVIADRLKRLVAEIPQLGCQIKLYEFETDEDYSTSPAIDDFEITGEILMNILDAFEQEVKRQMDLDSDREEK